MCGSSAGYLRVRERQSRAAAGWRESAGTLGQLGGGWAQALFFNRWRHWSRIAPRIPLCSDDLTLLCVLMFSARENLRGDSVGRAQLEPVPRPGQTSQGSVERSLAEHRASW